MKRITILLCFVGIITIILTSCQKESTDSNVQIILKASGFLSKSALSDMQPMTKSSAATLSTIELDAFFINIKDVEIELEDCYTGSDRSSYKFDDDDDYDDDEYDDDDTNEDIELEGPILIDVLSPEVLNGKVLGRVSLPYVTCEEIEFDIAPSRGMGNDKMADLSIFIKGTVDGMPFEVWTDRAREIEIDFDDDRPVNLAEEIRFLIDISLDKVRSNLETKILSTAVDGNNNGIIEIGHDDTDGNNTLSRSLLYTLIGSFDLDFDD